MEQTFSPGADRQHQPASHSSSLLGGDDPKERYRVIFWGQCAEGYDKSRVVRAFALRFNIGNKRQLAQVFSGRVLTLKRNLSKKHADRYVAVIQELGGVCRMENEKKDFFAETETKTRNAVSFLSEDFDPSRLRLSPKDEFSAVD